MNKNYTIIDLFAGIGGIRLAFEKAGFKSIYSNDINKSAISTYENHFKGKVDSRDIRKVKVQEIPGHTVLCGGFPCQPFSLAGVSARSGLGRKHGFEDTDQGNLFDEIVRILKFHKPRAVFLENVANFAKHDGGKSLKKVEKELSKLGYSFSYEIIDASLLVPQRRRRLYMVATLGDAFVFPEIEQKKHKLNDILEDDIIASKYTISDKLWKSHQERTKSNQKKGNGFRHNIVNLDSVANTLTSRYGKDGRENLVEQKGKNPRMLTPRECARLMGFSEEFQLPEFKTPSYRQLGNSVCVPIVEEIASALGDYLVKQDIQSLQAKKVHKNYFLPVMTSEKSPISG